MSIFKKKLTVNEAINAAHTSANAMLIDCRSKDDFNHGHVPGAVNIPLDKITGDRVLRRSPDQEKALYIIGSYQSKPEKAMKAFKKLGYKNVIFGGNMEEHYGILKKQRYRRLVRYLFFTNQI